LRILVALGGNAILQRKEKGTAEEQFANVSRACTHLAEIIKAGHKLAVTHGNGPQVGDILLKEELAGENLPHMPLDVCGAESQGMIGYMIQRAMGEQLRRAGLDLPVATVVTQTVVDRDDPAFSHPSKPIGPFYTEGQASALRKARGWTLVEDAGRGFRRVVPSPLPRSIVEGPTISKLFDSGTIVIASGGGGIPVIQEPDGSTTGAEAVIDKDYAAAVLGGIIKAEVLLMLTDVETVFLGYGSPAQRPIARMSLAECRKFLASGQFAPGSMKPKVEAAVHFIESGGELALIASLEKAKAALEGRAGTAITA
jgi:carbamate kinase